MTLHVDYDHSCSNCGAYYIPYDDNIPCPNCNTLDEERFAFISQAVDSMLYNKGTDGTFTPGAWWMGSFADHVLLILFGLFDSIGKFKGDELSLEVYVAEYLSAMNWEELKYLEKHVLGIAMRVSAELYG